MTDKEGWPLVDVLGTEACSPSSVDHRRGSLPPVVHYCQVRARGETQRDTDRQRQRETGREQQGSGSGDGGRFSDPLVRGLPVHVQVCSRACLGWGRGVGGSGRGYCGLRPGGWKGRFSAVLAAVRYLTPFF